MVNDTSPKRDPRVGIDPTLTVRKRGWLTRFLCKHRRTQWIRNIYGDEINHVSLRAIYRSWWQCTDCGELLLRKELNHAAD